MRGNMSGPVLYVACISVAAILDPRCILVGASPSSSTSSSADIRTGWTDIHTDTHTLVERGPLDRILDRDYSKAYRKGEQLWTEVMSAAPEQASGDRINAELLKDKTWPWQAVEQPKEDDLKDVTRDYVEALEIMEVYLDLKNTKNYFVKNKDTAAQYNGLYSPSNGIMIAYSRHSPSYLANVGQVDKSKIPEVHRWSDLAYLTWQHSIYELRLAQKDVKPLRAIFVGPITNSKSRDVIKKAIKGGHSGEDLPTFENAVELRRPSTARQKSDRPFLAVLGTENIQGVAYLLSQHHEGFGKKTIGSMLVYGKGENLYVKVEIVNQK